MQIHTLYSTSYRWSSEIQLRLNSGWRHIGLNRFCGAVIGIPDQAWCLFASKIMSHDSLPRDDMSRNWKSSCVRNCWFGLSGYGYTSLQGWRENANTGTGVYRISILRHSVLTFHPETYQSDRSSLSGLIQKQMETSTGTELCSSRFSSQWMPLRRASIAEPSEPYA